jgi:hypothetical protein
MSLRIRPVSLRRRVVAVAGALGLLLLGGALALGVLLAANLGHGSHTASAAFGDGSAELHIDVTGVAACTTGTGAPKPTPPPTPDVKGTCNIAFPSTFTVNAYIDSIGAASYQAIAVTLTYAGAVTAKPVSNVSPLNPDVASWPDCVFAARTSGPGSINAGCVIGVPPAPNSTYVGEVFSATFDCTQAGTGTITMKHGSPNDTLIAIDPIVVHTDKGPDVLNINCSSATDTPTITPTRTSTPAGTVTPTATPTITPTPQPNDDEDGDGIAHSIDTLPKIYSENFSDVYLGGTTFGTIFHAPRMTLSVSDTSFPAGVRVVGSGTGGPAPVVAFCSPKFRTFISPGSDETITCASADVHMNAGSAVTWFGTLMSKLTSGANVRVTEPSSGVYNVTNNGASGVIVGGVPIASGASANGLVDTDQDGLANSAETTLGSNPSVSDSDGDGLTDGLELAMYGTSPLLTDSDSDGLSDPTEIGTYHTNPALADTDGDVCQDGAEAQTAVGSELSGGRRDPLNPWDYFNPTHDGKNRSDDMLAVQQHYGLHQGSPGYSNAFDRTYIGPNVWNLGPPNGSVTSVDMLEIQMQYHHDCA